MSTLVENAIIKIDYIDIALHCVLLSTSPVGLKWFKLVTQHKSVKSDPVHGRLHFHVPHNVPSNSQDRVKQGSTEHFLYDPVPALTSGPVLALLVHKEEDLVQHQLELARILEPCEPTAAHQQIPDWEVHFLIKSNSVLIHSINRLLVGSLRLSRHMVLQTNLYKGHGSARYKSKTQSEERTTLIRFMQIRPANHRSS